MTLLALTILAWAALVFGLCRMSARTEEDHYRAKQAERLAERDRRREG